MNFPTSEQEKNVTFPSGDRKKRRLERRVRRQQVTMNDAWLRADAVYKAELAKRTAEMEALKNEMAVLKEELGRKNDMVDNLTRALRSLVCSDGKTAVHFKFLD